MSTLFVNPNSLYSNSQENFILNKDALYAFTRSISTVNNTLYGIQPTREQLLTGFSLSDIYAVNPISSNYSICANVDKLEQKISSVGTDISALEFFATKKFVKCTSELDRDQKAKNPLAVYLTPIPVDEYIPGKRPLSKRKLMNGLKELGKWDDFEAYLKATSDGANGTLWDQWDASTTLDEDNELVQGAITVLKDQFGLTNDQVEVLLENSIALNGQISDESNNFYEWIYVLSGTITWQQLQDIALSAETEPDFQLTSIPGDWELIGSTSITDGKLNSIINDFNNRIEAISAKVSVDLENYLALSGGNRTLSDEIYLDHVVGRIENPAAGKIQLDTRVFTYPDEGYYFPGIEIYYLSSSQSITEVFDQIADDGTTTITFNCFYVPSIETKENVAEQIKNISDYSIDSDILCFDPTYDGNIVIETGITIQFDFFSFQMYVDISHDDNNYISELEYESDSIRQQIIKAAFRLLQKYDYQNLEPNCNIVEEINDKTITFTLRSISYWSDGYTKDGYTNSNITNIRTELDEPLSHEPYAITSANLLEGAYFPNDKFIVKSELDETLDEILDETSSNIISEINSRNYISSETDPIFGDWLSGKWASIADQQANRLIGWSEGTKVIETGINPPDNPNKYAMCGNLLFNTTSRPYDYNYFGGISVYNQSRTHAIGYDIEVHPEVDNPDSLRPNGHPGYAHNNIFGSGINLSGVNNLVLGDCGRAGSSWGKWRVKGNQNIILRSGAGSIYPLYPFISLNKNLVIDQNSTTILSSTQPQQFEEGAVYYRSLLSDFVKVMDGNGIIPYERLEALSVTPNLVSAGNNIINADNNTFKYRNTIVVNSDGVIPAASIESGTQPSSIARLSDLSNAIDPNAVKLSDLTALSNSLISNDISAMGFDNDSTSLQFNFNNRSDISSVSIIDVLNKLSGDDGTRSRISVIVGDKKISATLLDKYLLLSDAGTLSNAIVENCTNTISGISSDLTGRIDGLSSELTALDGRVSSISSDLSNLSGNVESVKTDLGTLSNTVEHITSAYVKRSDVAAAVNNYLSDFVSCLTADTGEITNRTMAQWLQGIHKCLSSIGYAEGDASPEPPAQRTVAVNFYNSGDKTLFDPENDYIGTLTGNASLALTRENTKTFNDQISSFTLLGITHSLNGWIDVNSETTYMLSDMQNEQITITSNLSVLPSYN